MAERMLDVAVIGGGFSGVAAAIQIRKAFRPIERHFRIGLFEKHPDHLAAGIAYATPFPGHLLNVNAASMSVDDEEPASFLDWLAANAPDYVSNTFVPRHLYASYLKDALVRAGARYSNIDCSIIMSEVTRISPEGPLYRLYAESSGQFLAARVVLALGHVISAGAAIAGGVDRCLASPWRPASYEGIAELNEIAVVGTGLSGVDSVLECERRGFGGIYRLISRRGLLPHRHQTAQAPTAVPGGLLTQTSLPRLVHLMRSAVDGGEPWYPLVQGLRPHLNDIWRKLGERGQRQFLRHLRPYWDTHRHCIPQSSSDVIDMLRQAGRLVTIKGNVVHAGDAAGRFFLEVRERGICAHVRISADRIFDCSGQLAPVKSTHSRLLRQLCGSGLVSVHRLGFGLRCTEEGQALSAAGTPAKGLHVLGPLRKGDLWETIAVREIRAQAAVIARAISMDAAQWETR